MIFLGLGDICGYYSQLEQGLLEIGAKVTLVNAFPSGTYARHTAPSWIGRVVQRIALGRVAARRGSLRRACLTMLQGGAMVPLFIWAIVTCEVFVFGGGTSFFPPFDLWVLKRLGKRIVIVFHGSDARPPYINGSFACETPAEVAACIAQAARMKQRIRAIERHADVIINHSLSSHFHQRPVVGWLNIGIPSDVRGIGPGSPSAGDECVIVHAPTRPGPKGSAIFEAAIERLRSKGHRLTFVKLVGRTNAQVLAAIRDCDFVVDELFSDTTMASFATEAASFGKPAVVGLHGLALLRDLTQPHLLPPAVTCDAESVEAAIESLIVNPELRRAKGKEARQFVEEHWSRRQVAARFRRVIDDDVPQSWYFDPARVAYVCGWGLRVEDARRRVAAVIATGGIDTLQLNDKPDVRRGFAEFANGLREC